MLIHYLTVSLRLLRSQWLVSAINVLCLTLGLACFLAAWSLAAFFQMRDHYHANGDRIRLITNRSDAAGDVSPQTPRALAEALKLRFPQLERVGRMANPEHLAVSSGDRSRFAEVVFADPSILRIFDLPLQSGGRDALERPYSAVVSAALAQQLFGTDEAIGRSLRLANRGEVIVTGVLGPIREPSHLTTSGAFGAEHFDMLVTMVSRDALLGYPPSPGASAQIFDWLPFGFRTYVVLPASGSLTAEQMNAQMDALGREHALVQPVPTFRVDPLTVYTEQREHVRIGSGLETGNSVPLTFLLQILGAVILGLACLNYANLATAQGATRARDVALRRVVGARRGQLVAQYLLDAALSTGVALLLALVVLAILSTFATTLTLAQFASLFALMPRFWLLLGLILLGVTVAAGAYPAFVLSSVRPIHALRDLSSGDGARRRAGLFTGLQLLLASVLLITALGLVQQRRAMERSVETRASHALLLIANELRSSGFDVQVLLNELRQVSGVLSVTAASELPWGTRSIVPLKVALADAPDGVVVQPKQHVIGDDFFSTLEIPLLAGRTLSSARGDDVSQTGFGLNFLNGQVRPNDERVTHVVVDATLARRLGFARPADAIGASIRLLPPLDNTYSLPPRYRRIVGVVADSVLKPTDLGLKGAVYQLNPEEAVFPIVRLNAHAPRETLEAIDRLWHQLVPHEPLVRRFADEDLQLAFASLDRTLRILGLLALCALCIAMMGLFAMALHVVSRRHREIGIRKALGARKRQIAWMLLRGFGGWAVLANLIAWPLVFIGLRRYLEQFAIDAGLGWLPFLAGLGTTLSCTWLAVLVHVARTAWLTPAAVLRHE
ncbi:MAG TPA: ABC transporter permease [Povalibacter sp.]|uniref:ABC transporter permease n=1 Tax=Povalibacter sp. TaxID=1962978 RepID=UPI002D0B765C|nr:ABC transporter permease [Povalibacter sp.]HMN45819.1 ABC transporter permease [Povalibacter sp.]